MDGYLIIEFKTRTQAETALAVINQVAAAWWQSQGYTVINGELVPKNSDGTDNLTAQRTTTWDEVKKSPVGTFYISSLVNDPRFVDWRDYLPQGVSMPADKNFPATWITVS